MATTFVFSQKKSEVAVSGTVYIHSSISPGVIDGKVINEGTHLFKNQPIYFKSDSTTVKVITDSLGVFSTKLKEGSYIVCQEGGLVKKKSGMNHFGEFSVTIKKGQAPIKILFENSSNRRSAMNSGNSNSGTPTGKTTNKTHNTSKK